MMKDLIQENCNLLQQASELIESLSDAVFTCNDSDIYMSSAGEHVRHILDFYSAFLAGIEESVIDYDVRERNPAVSTNREAASSRITDITQKLLQLKTGGSPRNRLTIKSKDGLSSAGSEAGSTFNRELQFLLSHTMHHYAIFSMIVRMQKVEVPAHFGVARSTIEYLDSLS